MMLTFAEVCERLRMSPKTVRKLIVAGDIEAVKIGGGRWGGSYRVDDQAVDDYLQRQKVHPAARAAS
jgi:excisionase family DNA binding protein